MSVVINGSVNVNSVGSSNIHSGILSYELKNIINLGSYNTNILFSNSLNKIRLELESIYDGVETISFNEHLVPLTESNSFNISINQILRNYEIISWISVVVACNYNISNNNYNVSITNVTGLGDDLLNLNDYNVKIYI